MNIRDVLRQLGIPFREHGDSPHVTPGWIGIVCPRPACGQGGKYGRGINTRSLGTSCWKCGKARLGDVLAAASRRPLAEVLALLPHVGPDRTEAARVRTGRYDPPAGVGPLNAVHRRYLAGRGFDPDEIAELWGVGGIERAAEYPWRLFIPVFRRGEAVSWTTRAVGRREPRYMSAPPGREAVPIHDVLYGADAARHAVVVVEGPTDAWAIGPGAVATCGVGYTPAQVALIARYPVRAVCFDSEPAAQRRASRLCDELGVFPGQTARVELSGPDPATSPADELDELRKTFLE